MAQGDWRAWRRPVCCTALLTIATGGVLLPRAARADEPRLMSEPRVLAEPAERLRIVDAFDDSDLFDLHITLGFHHTSRSANIYREQATSGDSYTRANLPVAAYQENTSRLEPRLDVGLYRDLAAVIRLPIVLSNTRELSSLDGSEAAQSERLGGALGPDGTTEQLFGLPFTSPTRSGVEYLALGLDVGLMSQFRDAALPTWLLGFETRLSISKPVHACNPRSPEGQVDCAYASDVNRDGEDTQPDDGGRTGSRSPGVSRGTTGLELHTYISKRIRYLEPYGGVRALLEFADDDSDLAAANVRGSVVSTAPMEGSFVLGMSVYPWEARDQYQRIAVDFGYEGTYRSEGLDYSELYDALGSSDARNSLRLAHYTRYVAGPDDSSVIDPDSRRVYFTGVTDVQQHVRHRVHAEFVWQAGEYVRFKIGLAYALTQGHIITSSQSCNANISASADTAGRCRTVSENDDGSRPLNATGTPNPNYRPAIDAPGRRFRVGEAHDIDAWLSGVLMF